MDIFVGSLPFKISENELRAVFEKYGQVNSVKIIVNKVTRQNKGFGFVEMPNAKEATEAIELLNGTELMGRTIIVSKSEEKKDKPVKAVKDGKPADSKENITWRKNFFRKKPNESVVTYGDDNSKHPKGKGFQPRKKATNFKVGRRKKS